jgi:hypothetical protein
MKYVLTHYSGDWEWVREYTDDFLIYNRTDEEIPNSIKRENVGDADFDRLSYIVDNYYNLPDVFLLSKSNLLEKFITKEEFDEIKDNKCFTPLLTKNHKTYSDSIGPVCFYDSNGQYNERNNSWYLASTPALYFNDYTDFAKAFYLPNPQYLTFAPGGNYILTRDTVHKYGLDFYESLRSILPYSQRPGEAMMIERSLYTIWS